MSVSALRMAELSDLIVIGSKNMGPLLLFLRSVIYVLVPVHIQIELAIRQFIARYIKRGR